MEEIKSSEAQPSQALFSPGLELEDLELLSSSLSIFYESAKKKCRDLELITKKVKKQLLNQDGDTKQNSKQVIEEEVTEEYMVKHVREIIHRMGSYDRFRSIVKKAITSDSSGKSLKKLKTMHDAQDVRRVE